MKKLVAILATILFLALGNTVALAGSYTDTYESTPSMQQQSTSSSDTSTAPSTTSEQSNTTTPAEKNATDVTIKDFAFMPATMTIPMGSTVTWTNADSTAHTVTGDTSGGPSSGTLQPGQSYSFTFANPGTFPYHCSIHPMMKGTVVVTEMSNPSVNSESTTPNSTPSSTSTPSTPAASSTEPTNLPNTGAGNIPLVFGVGALAGTIGYTLYLLKKAPAR